MLWQDPLFSYDMKHSKLSGILTVYMEGTFLSFPKSLSYVIPFMQDHNYWKLDYSFIIQTGHWYLCIYNKPN